MKIRIDVWSDIACPWCWIGKRNLAAATEQAGVEVQTHWHAFELAPDAPRDVDAAVDGTVDYAARLGRKYGTSTEQAQAMIDRMVAAGEAAGVTMRFDRIRPSNTFDAHRLLAWAADEGEAGAQGRLKERLFQAYLGEGRVMADRETLAELAGDVGLGTGEAAAVLDSDRYAEAVRRDEATASELGITGVPSFVVDQRFLLTGAQPPDVIGDVLAQAAGDRRSTET